MLKAVPRHRDLDTFQCEGAEDKTAAHTCGEAGETAIEPARQQQQIKRADPREGEREGGQWRKGTWVGGRAKSEKGKKRTRAVRKRDRPTNNQQQQQQKRRAGQANPLIENDHQKIMRLQTSAHMRKENEEANFRICKLSEWFCCLRVDQAPVQQESFSQNNFLQTQD